MALALLLACGAVPRESRLHGTWRGTNGETSVRLEVEPDGRCRLELGGEESAFALAGRCEVDVTKSPIPLTIRGISRLDHPLHTIVEFRGPDELHIAPFATRWRLRPVAFDVSRRVVLHRAREGAVVPGNRGGAER